MSISLAHHQDKFCLYPLEIYIGIFGLNTKRLGEKYVLFSFKFQTNNRKTRQSLYHNKRAG